MRDLAALPKAHVHLHLDGSMRRNRPPHEATALARLAVARRDDGVVGFGLDGDETTAPGTSFAQAYSVAREGGLRPYRTRASCRPPGRYATPWTCSARIG
jgi:adenosine deaminase